MKAPTRERPRAIGLLVIAVAVPLVLVGILIMLEHWDVIPSSAFLPWQFNVALVILPGLIPISFLRWAVKWRIASGLLYFVAMFAIMPMYGLIFACTFTGDCL